MRRTFAILLASAFALTGAAAQDALKTSGYIQLQNQWGQRDAALKVGAPNENPGESFNRFGIRRGRIKFTHGTGNASAVFQLDITEKGLGIKDAYLNLKDPWIGAAAFKAGVFDRPFGYEISYSSSTRESPERSTIFQTLFPEERDMGAMFVLQAPKSSPWSIFKLEAGLFAGNGIKQETDSRKDFIGHLSVAKEWGGFSFGAGASYYNGRVYQGTANVYTMRGGDFVLDDDQANIGKFARRKYFGFDARIALKSALGTTSLNGEYLFGRQPGTESSSKSPNASVLPAADTWLRDFRGGYAMLVQSLGKSPVSLVAKYDRYDPNTNGNVTRSDIAQSTWGVGALWNLDAATRLTAYYDINRNEGDDRRDNVFTLRLQYKF